MSLPHLFPAHAGVDGTDTYVTMEALRQSGQASLPALCGEDGKPHSPQTLSCSQLGHLSLIAHTDPARSYDSS